MDKVHFTQANLFELNSAFLDPKGHILTMGSQTGVHEEMAYEIFEELYGSANHSHEGYGYAYEYVEEELGYWRYSHWVGQFGVWNGKKEKMTNAQKLALRAFCRANNCTWEQVVRY